MQSLGFRCIIVFSSVKKNKLYEIMLLGILSIIALLGIGWYFGSQKLLADAEERVVTAWSALDQAYQQEENLAARLLEYAVATSDLGEKLSIAWQQSVELVVNPAELNTANVRRYQERKSRLGQVLDELITDRQELSEEASRSIRAAEILYLQTENDIREKINHYNADVAACNRLVGRFPFSLLNYSEKPFYPETS